MELVCPAGSLAALKIAVDCGADAVYIGFKDDTNARHFAGLNFTDDNVVKAIDYAKQRQVKVFVAINTYAQSKGWERWQRAVDVSASCGIDAVICADMSVMDYAANNYPNLNLHLSVQGSATNRETLNFFADNFGVKRAVLPRVLSLKQVETLASQSPIDLEVFAFGSLCIMAEGRCYLSSYLTDESPNNCGACSPAKAVRWEQKGDQLYSRLNGLLIDKYGAGEKAGYPTLCKGRFNVNGRIFNAIEEPTSLNTIELIPALVKSGIKAVKIEGRQRSPAYVENVVKTWRKALDSYQNNPSQFTVKSQWHDALLKVSEGTQTTLGAYTRSWQ